MISMSYQHDKDLSKTMSEREETLEKVSDTDFGIMSAEEVFFQGNTFGIIFDDLRGVSHNFSCNNIKLRITPACLAARNTNYYNPKTIGHIWEVKNSRLVAKLLKVAEECTYPGDQMRDLMEGLDKGGQKHPGVRHYILPLKDHLIEIIASDVGLNELERPPYKDLSYKPKDPRDLHWRERYVVIPEDLRGMSPSKIEGLATKVSDFRFNSTPLERFRYNNSGLEVYADDRSGETYKISFNKCLKVDVMDADVASVMVNEYYRAGGYTLIEVEGSKLIEELKKDTADPSLIAQLERSKHFVLPMRDNLVEVVAEDISIEKVPGEVHTSVIH